MWELLVSSIQRDPGVWGSGLPISLGCDTQTCCHKRTEVDCFFIWFGVLGSPPPPAMLKVTPGGVPGIYGMPGIEPDSTLKKTNALPAVLLLWPKETEVGSPEVDISWSCRGVWQTFLDL